MGDETTPYARARALQSQGATPGQIREALAGGGLDPNSVNVVLASLCSLPLRREPERVGHLQLEPTEPSELSSVAPGGRHDLYLGAVMVVAGVAITLVTHEAAEARGGGTYLLAWGPIVFGALRFLRGLFASGE